tara:strand:+ start:496 stop:657 length:162 start_codon:yes stop_codon:yes gene_type:complete
MDKLEFGAEEEVIEFLIVEETKEKVDGIRTRPARFPKPGRSLKSPYSFFLFQK